MSKLVILAAGEGKRLRPYALDKPKCLVELHGKTILDWQVDIARQLHINDIVVIKGYKQEKISRKGIRSYINPEYLNSNMVETLWCAHEELEDDIVISYGDIIYGKNVLEVVMETDREISVTIDKDWLSYWKRRFVNPLDDAESLRVDLSGRILEIGQKVKDISNIQGQFIGLLRFKGKGIDTLKNFYKMSKEATGREKKIFR